MTSSMPVDLLEKRAAEQRRQIHNSVVELRQSVKGKLDVKRNLYEHLWPAAGVMNTCDDGACGVSFGTDSVNSVPPSDEIVG